MTRDQKDTDHIATREHLNRHADQRYVFYFFPTAQKKLKFCRHTIGTFGFAPPTSRHTGKAKRTNFPPRPTNSNYRQHIKFAAVL